MSDKLKPQMQVVDYPDEIALDEKSSQVKDLLLQADEIQEFEMPEIDFDRLHAKIMHQVEKTEIKKPSAAAKLWSDKAALAAIRQKVYCASAILSLIGVVYINAPRIAKVVRAPWNASSLVVDEADKGTVEMLALSSYQHRHDFFVDVASASLDHLSKEQIARLMGTTRVRKTR